MVANSNSGRHVTSRQGYLKYRITWGKTHSEYYDDNAKDIKYNNAKKLIYNACNEATKRHQEYKEHCKFKIDINGLIEPWISQENTKLIGKKLNAKSWIKKVKL